MGLAEVAMRQVRWWRCGKCRGGSTASVEVTVWQVRWIGHVNRQHTSAHDNNMARGLPDEGLVVRVYVRTITPERHH